MQFESAVQNLLTAAMTVTAAVLVLVALRAYRHTGRVKIAYVAGAFALFFIKGVILSAGLFLTTGWGEVLLPWSVALDLGILVLFYLAILKRSPR
ncbi:MAG: hypothetical protein ACPHID_04440 [Thermoplasmatota archaeon]